jgi:hypothetical protein
MEVLKDARKSAEAAAPYPDVKFEACCELVPPTAPSVDGEPGNMSWRSPMVKPFWRITDQIQGAPLTVVALL